MYDDMAEANGDHGHHNSWNIVYVFLVNVWDM